jgi:HSP20 family protein
MIHTTPTTRTKPDGRFHSPGLFTSKNAPCESTPRWNPLIDIFEDASCFKVLFEIPGMNERDIMVNASSRQLVVRGERKRESDNNVNSCGYFERGRGNFERKVSFPTDVLSSKVEIFYQNGLLTVFLPKSATCKPRPVTVIFED